MASVPYPNSLFLVFQKLFTEKYGGPIVGLPTQQTQVILLPTERVAGAEWFCVFYSACRMVFRQCVLKLHFLGSNKISLHEWHFLYIDGEERIFFIQICFSDIMSTCTIWLPIFSLFGQVFIKFRHRYRPHSINFGARLAWGKLSFFLKTRQEHSSVFSYFSFHYRRGYGGSRIRHPNHHSNRRNIKFQ